MYLFTISFGSYAVDQRSGGGWISGWSQIFAFHQRNSWSRLWVTWRENCFSIEQNHPEYPIQEKGQSGGNESSKRRPLPPRKTDRLLDLRVLPGHWGNDSVENYADLFTIALRNDDIQEFDSKWHEILLSMTKIPHDDIISTSSTRIASMEFINRRAAPFVHSGEKWKARTRSRSEMPVWTVSQRFSHPQWRRLFKELWGRPITTADFGSSLWQIPYTSYVCLLEDKFQGPRYVLVHNSLRKLCNGSKKWRWLIQWMN